MTKIKLCGLSRPCDIDAANKQKPEYIGFVFTQKSQRYVTPQQAEKLKQMLSPEIKAVGVFVNEDSKIIAALLKKGIIDIVQLHGNEDETYISQLHSLFGKPIIKAFRIVDSSDIEKAKKCTADYILLDSGAGTGTVFDWNLIKNIKRPYFLAGGLDADNVRSAIRILHPYAVDVSSGIETDGKKDSQKMTEFISAVRKEGQI